MALVDKPYDVIVVGAGIIGLYTSYTMAAKGSRVLLLDQFQVPHKRGSSGDASRIIRLFYNKQSYVDMARDAYTRWQHLEKVTGEQLIEVTGALAISSGPWNASRLKESAAMMERSGLPHEVLSTSQMRQRFPMFRFDDGSTGLYDTDAGCMMAARCNRVLLAEFLKHGGILRDAEKVTKITPGELVTVTTTRGRHVARQVVLAPGPWARDLLLGLGLDVPLMALPAVPCYWREKVAGDYSNAAGMPIFVHDLDVPKGYQFIYGFPSREYPGLVKVATRGEPALALGHPDERDFQDRDVIMSQLRRYIERHLPGVDHTRPAITEGCVYTRTPDGDFIIDRHPQHANILIAAGGSGHAFKMAPVFASLIAEMAAGKPTTHDVTPFRVTRFKPSAKI